MNRRGFLSGIIAATVFIPKAFDAYKWVKTKELVWVPNPDYVNAPYEIVFIGHVNCVHHFKCDRQNPKIPEEYKDGTIIVTPNPVRFDCFGNPITPQKLQLL